LEFIFPNSTFASLENSLESNICSNLNLHTNQATDIEHFDAVRKYADVTESYQSKHYPLVVLNRKKLNKLAADFAENSMILQLQRDVYTFISCGVPQRETLNFMSLFIPFEKLTWGLILMTTFVWPLLLSLIEHDFCFKSVLNDFDACSLGGQYFLNNRILDLQTTRAGNVCISTVQVLC